MNCKDIQKRLPLLATGEIEASDAIRMQEHLEGCESCRADYEELCELVGVLDSRPALTETERLRLENDVLRKLSIDARGPARRFALPQLARTTLRLAAGIMLFAAGYLTQSRLQDPREEHSAPAPAWSVSDVRNRAWAGQRLSGQGLQVIARGRSALPAETAPGI